MLGKHSNNIGVEILEDQAEPIPMPGFEFDREELVPARWHRKDSV